jgi:transcriptional regulator with XRE-family HTH domain
MAAGRDDDSNTPPDYSRNVGQRVRSIRKQKRMSLQEVESASSQEFKASVLGAYERGERAISVPRLQRLAGFYNVPVDQLLPHDENAIDLREHLVTDDRSVKINLTRLEEIPGPEADMLNRYLKMIQVQRQDFNGRVLTVRRDDMRAIACILGTGVEGAPERLAELGLAYQG